MEHRQPRSRKDECHDGAAGDPTLDALARETNGQFRPDYEFIARRASALAIGEVVREPHLGIVRVANTEPAKSFVHIAWSDDYGPCRPVGRYRADQPIAVRAPGQRDRLMIQQSLDQAARHGRELRPDVARLIAAHLNLGPRSALYRFALNGAVREELFDELDQIHAGQPAHQTWVHALGRYCVNRLDWRPIIGWGSDNSTAPPVPSASRSADNQLKRTNRQKRGIAAMGKRVPVETVEQLLDAAFELGQRVARHAIAQPCR